MLRLNGVETRLTTILEEVEIVFEDDQIVIVNKPSGLFCHPSAEHLEPMLKRHYQNPDFVIRDICRLDKSVFGLVLFAKTKEASAFYANHVFDKIYPALMEGIFEKKDD